MSALEVRELLLAHDFAIEAEKRRLEKERKKAAQAKGLKGEM